VVHGVKVLAHRARILSPLSQANNGNVQLVHQESNKDANGLSFRLKLLSDQRMHERFTGTELGNIDM
jgi:hypothetical protein